MIQTIDRRKLPPSFDPPEWTRQAKCLGMDTDIFFQQKEKQAKRICRSCPVWLQCRTFALDIPYGIFGGLNGTERFRIAGRLGPNEFVRHGQISDFYEEFLPKSEVLSRRSSFNKERP